MNIFQSLQGVFRKKQPQAPTSNLSSQARQSNYQVTNPNRNVARPSGYSTPSYTQVSRPQQNSLNGSGGFGISPAVSSIGRTNVSSDPTAGYKAVRAAAQPRVSVAPRMSTASQAQPRTAQTGYQAPVDPMTAYYNRLQANRTGAIDKNVAGDVKYYQDSYDAATNSLKNQIPMLQQGFNQFKDATMAGIGEQEGVAQSDIQKAIDEAGSAQRGLAETKRDLQGQRDRQYAALGSIDSYGTGSYTQTNANDDANFLRMTNQNLQAKADRIASIESGLRQFKQQAQMSINQENAKLQQALNEIQNNVTLNELDKQNLVRQVYAQAQQNKQDIMDEYDGYRLQLQLEKNSDGLSQTFLTTGQPENQADYEFYLQNPDKVSKFQGMIGGGNNADRSNLTGLISELLNSDLNGISGYGRYNPLNALPGAGAQLTKNKFNQLQSLLSLDNRSKLKGSGAISDFEAKMLANAASSLGTNLSPEQLRQQLLQLQKGFGGQQQQYDLSQFVK